MDAKISADGLIVAGTSSSSTSDSEAFRWTTEKGMVGLGELPGGEFHSYPYDVSADGSIVVGRGCSESDAEAIIWDADNGAQSLKDMLVNNFDLGLTGWTLTTATGISADGLTIVGYGTNPDGYTEAWIATIPEPSTLLLLGPGGLMLRRRK